MHQALNNIYVLAIISSLSKNQKEVLHLFNDLGHVDAVTSAILHSAKMIHNRKKDQWRLNHYWAFPMAI